MLYLLSVHLGNQINPDSKRWTALPYEYKNPNDCHLLFTASCAVKDYQFVNTL